MLKIPRKLVSACITILRRRLEDNFRTIRLSQNLKKARTFAEKDEKPNKGPAKKEDLKVNMPGFINPENLKEEGYFTQKAKKQLEELKRNVTTQQTLTNPEKKES